VASLGTLWRAPLGSLLTASVIGVALALPSGLYLIFQGVSEVTARFGDPYNISAYLRPELDDSQGEELARGIREREDVVAVRLIGKRAALEEFRAAAGLASGLEAFADHNPLPVVLVITPKAFDRRGLDTLARDLRGIAQVEFLQAERDWLQRLEAILAVVRQLLWLSAALLSVGVMLVVGNTLRLTIEARRAEVEVAKLFGASDAFVRRPFLYQGLLYGGCGALLACILVLVCSLALAAPLERLAGQYAASLEVSGPGPVHLIALLAIGCGLGLLGAWLWVSRHLRVIQPR
jgi:cell division transport system permease protein